MNRSKLKFLPIFAVGIVLSMQGNASAQVNLQQSPKEVSNALQRIGTDVTQQRDLLMEDALRKQRDAQVSAEAAAANIRAEGRRVATEMRNAYIPGSTKAKAYTTEQINAAQAEYELRASRLEDGGGTYGAAAQKDFNDRSRRLQESAMNLQEQLTQTPSAADSVILQPRGTNLYVRNYQTVGEQMEKLPPVQPQHAVEQQSLLPANRATAGAWPPNATRGVANPMAPRATPSFSSVQTYGTVRTKVTGSLVKE